MEVCELTDDYIGKPLWVRGSLTSDWCRVYFEGLTTRPLSATDRERDGGDQYWCVLMCSPQPGVMLFRSPSGKQYTGLLVRNNAEVWPVEVDLGVDENGQIVELGERAA